MARLQELRLTPVACPALSAMRVQTRARAYARALAAMFLFVVAACGGLPSESAAPTVTPTAAPSGGIAIPTDALPPHIACHIANGARLVEVEPPIFPGEPPRYVLEVQVVPGQDPREAAAAREACDRLAPPPPQRSDEDIREIYDRWVGQRLCLIELGYTPAEPPSFEQFLSDWRGEGPWTPIDGVNIDLWTADEYRLAKERCTLEFLEL
jgi:hypothetical protein